MKLQEKVILIMLSDTWLYVIQLKTLWTICKTTSHINNEKEGMIFCQ